MLLIVGERLKRLRKERGVTAQALADAIGVKRRVLVYYESSDRDPSLESIVNIANYFDCSIDYLVGRSDDPERH